MQPENAAGVCQLNDSHVQRRRKRQGVAMERMRHKWLAVFVGVAGVAGGAWAVRSRSGAPEEVAVSDGVGAPSRAASTAARRRPTAGVDRPSPRAGAPLLSAAASAHESKPARVSIPRFSDGATHLEDGASGTSVDVTLQGASPRAAQTIGGYVVYPGALASGATVIQRPIPSGTEDFISFPARPDRAEIQYRLTLGSQTAGLRLVGGTLEMLDASGTPRLRVPTPYIVGADGVRVDGALAVNDCAVDTDPSAPWGRPATPPGGASCTVTVTWADAAVVYPAVLDPRWTTTGSMATTRFEHTLVLLSMGRALAAGGRSTTSGTTGLTSAELYDPTTGTWSATGSLAHGRRLHSATQLPTSSNPTTGGKVLVAGGISG